MGEHKKQKTRMCKICQQHFTHNAEQMKLHATFCEKRNWESKVLTKPTYSDILKIGRRKAK